MLQSLASRAVMLYSHMEASIVRIIHSLHEMLRFVSQSLASWKVVLYKQMEQSSVMQALCTAFHTQAVVRKWTRDSRPCDTPQR